MTPPMFKHCACGHLGGRHSETGVCALCDCTVFRNLVFRYARQAPGAVISKPNRRRNRRSSEAA